jgi:hypothetical protein
LGSNVFVMPTFECTVCGRKIRSEFELSCTGDVKRNVEKAPWCCGKEMIESIDD